MDINELIVSEDIQIKRLEELVQNAVKEEKMLTSKLIELEESTTLTLGQKLADKVANFGGSWVFISAFGVFLLIWILLNVYWLMNKAFDPYPFIFLNLILSCLAALQAPIIMMSQNRQEDKDRIRARSDYMINLKSEMEIRSLHSKIDLLISEEMKTLFQVQQSQMEILLNIQAKLK
ncbi:MAG: DUF1003 domain-containing protein [bacterium]